jgi:L-lactate permease
MWDQHYNPLNNAALSTIAAALPVVTLLVLIASGKVKAHIAALIALIVANIITVGIFTMPANMSIRASLLGVVVGVMGKMIDAQSIVVASTATNWYGHEGSILRYVFWHSIVLACLVGVLVTLQAYVYPFTLLVLK